MKLVEPFLAAALAILVAAPAEAKIRCRNGMQEVGGGLLSTPYCEDQYLAEVAREYGTRISAETIRNNPLAKRDICRFIGRDIRVQNTCIPYINGGRGRF